MGVRLKTRSGLALIASRVWWRVTHTPFKVLRKAKPFFTNPAGLRSLRDLLRVSRALSRGYASWLSETPEPRRLVVGDPAPTISLLVPVYNTPEPFLRQMIDSVRRQTYPRWELCIADDASTAPHVRPILAEAAASAPRIRVYFRPQNGHIAAASNSALSIATGDFVGLLDHDDVLAPGALAAAAAAIVTDPAVDVLYTDEDKITSDGTRLEPYFKPGWSPNLLLSINYITHFAVLRRELAETIGGFREAFVGSQDYDLFLRAAERAGRIIHIPQMAYSWRKSPTSSAISGDVKNYAESATTRALQEAVDRRGLKAAVEPGAYWPFLRVRYELEARPLISIIRQRPLPHHYPQVEQVARAEDARGDVLLFLAEDAAPIGSGWLPALLEYGQMEAVGAVGGKLYGPDGRLACTGIGVDRTGTAYRTGHGLADVPYPIFYPNALKDAAREVTAISADCLLIRRALYREMQGDTPAGAPGWELALCQRLLDAGRLNVFTPYARFRLEKPRDPLAGRSQPSRLDNPHLSPEVGGFGIASHPEPAP